MRPEPAQIFPQIFTALDFALVVRLGRGVVVWLFVFSVLNQFVEPAVLVIVDERPIALARRATSFGACWPISHVRYYRSDPGSIVNSGVARGRSSQSRQGQQKIIL